MRVLVRICWGSGLLLLSSALAWGGDGGSASATGARVVTGKKTAPDEEIGTYELGEIVVTGNRASLATAQEIKRNKMEIVDSVVADDINKLPDFNVTDAIQRVTGIQVLRDRGEGAGVAIRGLTQMETTLNGREVFTAGNGRNLDFADVPAEMVAGIDVYKTSSASQIEGGIGGLVDLRTRRPFDFSGRQIAVSGRVVHGDLVNQSRPQFSLLASDRGMSGIGEVGALLNVSYQKRAWREDQSSFNAPRAITSGGQTAYAPNGWSDTVTLGERERIGLSGILQWRPSSRLDLYAELHHMQFKTWQDGYQLFVTPAGTFNAASVSLFPGTSDVQNITWTNPAVASWGSARDTVDRTTQAAAGGTWKGDDLTLKADLSYTKSYNNLFYSVITANGTAASLTQNTASGGNLLSTPAFGTAGMVYASRPFDGNLAAAQLDGEYRFRKGFLNTLSAGLRYARREATDAPGQVVFSNSGVPLSNAAGLLTLSPYNGYLVGDPASARDETAVYNALGGGKPVPASNPLGTWTIHEDTVSAYLMGKFQAERLPLDGNLGVRLVHTREQVAGNRSDPATGGTLPLDIRHDYLDTLPSLNLRYELAQGLYLRGAASKSLTRPDFLQLSPSLILNAVSQTGTAGNPALRPIRADNYDLALERYFNRNTFTYLTVFKKEVDGFLTTVSTPETYGGITYQVSRPQNTDTGHIRGVEIGYQQFYDFLPGWLSGLGLQANATWIDSRTPSSLLGQDVPLQNLSKRSYNLVGLYEKGPVSARLAYNWRDKFLSSIASVSGVGALPVYTKAYGWLDASFRYRVDKRLTLAVESTNLLNTRRESYYGVETRPQTTWRNDRQISLSVSLQFQ